MDGGDAPSSSSQLPVFTSLVDAQQLRRNCCIQAAGQQASPPLKTQNDVRALLAQSRKQDTKFMVRNNCWPVDSPVRAGLWLLLASQHADQSRASQSFANEDGGFYWDMVNQVFGSSDLPEKSISLPPFVEPAHCQLYYLSGRGRNVADRVVSVLGYACPDIVYSPTIYPICALLLHYMSEEECYHCITSLVAAKQKTFIVQTKLVHEVTWKTVMHICRKHAKGAAVHLLRYCSSANSERIYMDWIWWIFHGLPFQHLVRIMDCFLHEGIKVLYRTVMAILILFHKASTSSSSSAPNEGWVHEIQRSGIDAALNKFCREIPVTPRKVLKIAFGIRGLSSASIARIYLRTEMTLKSRHAISGSRQLVRSRSSENLPNSQSQNNIQMVSHTLTIREAMPEEMYNEMLLTLWSWLPVRITMYQPILLYTTEEHGCSLTTFYVRVEQHEPTLMMIKTCNNEVFGAYCSSRWCERNRKDTRGNRQAYFGTGETFLFSLYPERAKYQWVGIDGEKVDHGSELFMAADSTMITIGGGNGQAIWMDENIRFGKTDHCQTFNNPPLCPSGDFEIRVLEVYGFATDQI